MAVWSEVIDMSKSFIARNVRVGKFSALLASGNAFRLTVEKLCLLPLCLKFLGEESFGHFVWLLGWAMMLGMFATGGLGDSMLRLHSEAKKDGSWPALVRTSVALTSTVSLISLLLAGAVYLILETRGDLVSNALMVGGLGAYFLLLANRSVLDTLFRVELHYHKTAMVEATVGIVLLAAIPLAYLFGKVGLSWGFALAAGAGISLQIALLYKQLREQCVSQISWTKRLMVVAPPFILASAMGMAFYHAGRLVLGFFRSYRDVTVFFAAESVAILAIVPLHYLANVVYAMIARKSSVEELSRGALLQFLVSCLIGSAGVYAGLMIIGRWILMTLYPSVGAESWPLLQILAIGAAAKVLFFLCRGFVFRFCSLKRIMLYSVLNFAVLIAILLPAVHIYGLVGAAWAVTAGGVFAGVLWFGTYLHIFIFRRNRPVAA